MSDEFVSVKIPGWLRDKLEDVVHAEKKRSGIKLTYAQLLVQCWEQSLGREHELNVVPRLVEKGPKPAPFQCPEEHIPFHKQLEMILGDPEERGGITANLKWGSRTVEGKRKVKKA